MVIGFQFRWIPFLAMLCAAALGVSLGRWQDGRAAQKQGLEEKLALRLSEPPLQLGASLLPADEAEFRRVKLKGEFVRGWPLYLDNRPHQGRAGFYVMMPFKLLGSDTHVLLARGWTARGVADRTQVPAYATPEGVLELEGVARRELGQVMRIGAEPALRPGAILQNLDLADVAQAAKLKMQPFVVEQSNMAGTQPDSLVRDWPRPSSGIDRHRGYAFQWYGLALMAFVFFLMTGVRRGSKTAD